MVPAVTRTLRALPGWIGSLVALIAVIAAAMVLAMMRILRALPDWVGSLVALVVLAGVTALVSAMTWPGHLNVDTIGELQEAQSGSYTDWHTPLLSALWHVLIAVGLGSPGWVLAGGVLTLLVGLYLILRVVLPRPLAVPAAALVLAFPPVLGFAIVLGTDSWFAAAILCGFGFAARAARTEGPARVASAALAVVAGLLAQAARPTAAPAVLLLLCGVALSVLPTDLRGLRRALGVAAAGAVGVALVFGTVYGTERWALRAAQLHPEQTTYDYDLIAMSIQQDRVLLPREMYARADVAPLRRLARPSSAKALDIAPVLFSQRPLVPWEVEGGELDALHRAWVAALVGHPGAYLQERLDLAGWQLAISGPAFLVVYGTPHFPAQPPGSGFSPTNPALDRGLSEYVARTGTNDGLTGGPLQRVWAYVVAMIVFAAAAIWSRRRPDIVLALLAGAVLVYTVEIVLLSPGVTYRYVYPTVAAGSVLVLVLAALGVRGLWALLKRTPRNVQPPAVARFEDARKG